MSALPPPDPRLRAIDTPALTDAANAVVTAAWLLIMCGSGAAVGSVLPWGQITTALGVVAVDGVQGDGKLTLAVGVFVAAVGMLALRSRATYNLVVLGLVGACAVVAITGYNAYTIAGLRGDPDLFGAVDVGYGLWLTLAAGVAGILGGALLIQQP